MITKYQSKTSSLIRALHTQRMTTRSDSGEHKRCPESSACLSCILRRGQTRSLHFLARSM